MKILNLKKWSKLELLFSGFSLVFFYLFPINDFFAQITSHVHDEKVY